MDQLVRRGLISHAPNSVKRQVLLRYGGPDSVWIESGTFMGGTAAFLGRHASFVYSIEVDHDSRSGLSIGSRKTAKSGFTGAIRGTFCRKF